MKEVHSAAVLSYDDDIIQGTGMSFALKGCKSLFLHFVYIMRLQNTWENVCVCLWPQIASIEAAPPHPPLPKVN